MLLLNIKVKKNHRKILVDNLYPVCSAFYNVSQIIMMDVTSNNYKINNNKLI